MNSEPELSPAVPPAIEPREPFDRIWRDWARRLLVCNPCFLASAALLLYGINRLANDPGFPGDETANLLFNFFALHLYEALLIGTAFLLARRKVWYDSALLVVLDQGLIFVPFMLLSQATLLDPVLGWQLALLSGALAAGRLGMIRRGYRLFHLPDRARGLGLLFIAVNLALPLICRSLIELTVDDWQVPNWLGWHVILPALAAGVNLLPRPQRYGGLQPERSWLPLAIHALWTTGTGVHNWSIGYICKIPLDSADLAPVIWVSAWSLWNRLSDCLPRPGLRWNQALLTWVLFTPLFASRRPEWFEFFAVLNACGFAAVALACPGGMAPALNQALLGSVGMMIAGLPLSWIRLLMPTLGRGDLIVTAVLLYAVLVTLRSRHRWRGWIGALALGCLVGKGPGLLSPALGTQIVLLVLLLQSMRWIDRGTAEARKVQLGVLLLWVMHAYIWVGGGTAAATWGTLIGAMLIVVAWHLDQQRNEAELTRWVPCAAALVLLSRPVTWAIRTGSPGLLALTASLLLFGAGAALAWTRYSWDPTSRNDRPRRL